MVYNNGPLRVLNQNRQQLLMTRGQWAASFWARLRGLTGRPPLREGEGLILVGDRSIHSFFMRFPIDVVYADRDWRVVRLDAAMAPNRIGPYVGRAAYVPELPVGVIHHTGTTIGDQLVCHADVVRD